MRSTASVSDVDHASNIAPSTRCCIFNTMQKPSSHPPRVRDAVHLKIGRWFEASARGWGVVIVPLALALVLGAAVAIGRVAG